MKFDVIDPLITQVLQLLPRVAIKRNTLLQPEVIAQIPVSDRSSIFMVLKGQRPINTIIGQCDLIIFAHFTTLRTIPQSHSEGVTDPVTQFVDTLQLLGHFQGLQEMEQNGGMYTGRPPSMDLNLGMD